MHFIFYLTYRVMLHYSIFIHMSLDIVLIHPSLLLLFLKHPSMGNVLMMISKLCCGVGVIAEWARALPVPS